MREILMTALIFAGILSGCSSQNNVVVNGEKIELKDGLYTKIATNKGDILLKLHYNEVPMTVANFVGLAEGKIKNTAKPEGEPFYDDLKFHRVVAEFMIQGGDPQGNGSGGPGYSFPDEFHPDLKHDGPGVLSMANEGLATNGSQFFITHKETSWLNGKHSVFGRVIKGQDVVDKVAQDDLMEKVEIIRIGKYLQNYEPVMAFEEAKAKNEKKRSGEAKERAKAVEKYKEGAEKTPGGLYYKVLKEGEGPKPEEGQTIQVHYAGYLADGTLFDTSLKELAEQNNKYDPRREPYPPFEMSYGPDARVIRGWIEGLQLMRVGDKHQLIVPPALGYGSRGVPGLIPADSWLIFEVELMGIK